MDPFEGRLQFLELLRKLSASQQSQLKTAHFAIRHRDLDEDLYSCVLEELEQTSLNARVNILFFLETLCDASRRAGAPSYIFMVQRDLRTIINAVAPNGSQGAANIVQFVQKLREKDFIAEGDFAEIDQAFASRDAELKDSNTNSTFSREDILRRIEEDRERHKRLRENIWVIPRGDDNYEFDQAWETTSSLDNDDLEHMHEENEKVYSNEHQDG